MPLTLEGRERIAEAQRRAWLDPLKRQARISAIKGTYRRRKAYKAKWEAYKRGEVPPDFGLLLREGIQNFLLDKGMKPV